MSALHIVEAARLGAAGVFLAGCAEGRCQFRTGDTSAAAQAALAGELLAEAGLAMPLELWHLCAVDRGSVGRRIRLFCARAQGDEAAAAMLVSETDRVDRPAWLVGAAGRRGCSAGAGAPRGPRRRWLSWLSVSSCGARSPPWPSSTASATSAASAPPPARAAPT